MQARFEKHDIFANALVLKQKGYIQPEREAQHRRFSSCLFIPLPSFPSLTPHPGYLCPLNANKYGVEFLKFMVSDNDSRTVVYEVSCTLSLDGGGRSKS
jgi:hypothetical protein